MRILFKITLLIFTGTLFPVNSIAQCVNKPLETDSAHWFVMNVLERLTLEEKVSLLNGMGRTRNEFGDLDVSVFGIKGIPEKGIPDFIMGHGITGVRTGRDTKTYSTFFGSPLAFASIWDTELYGRIGKAIALEMRGLGQDLNLGPTLNIIRHPLGGRNWESLSEDPYLTSRYIVPYVKEMQTNGIICGPKHFAANNQEHNRSDINNVMDERTLREIYLPAFKAAVMEGGALNIMGAYNRLNGVFMCQNKYMLTDILRNEWGFQGFVLSDFSNGLRSTLAGVYGGLNVEMMGVVHYGEKLLQEIDNGAVSASQIDSMLYDVLKTMYAVNAFNRPRREHEKTVHSPDHQALASEVAKQAPVLLKNHKNILPLNLKKIKSLAIIGPNAKRFETLPLTNREYAYYLQGGGSGRTYYYHDAVIDPFTGLSRKFNDKIKISYAQGCQTPDYYGQNKVAEKNHIDERLIQEAVAVAKKSDVAILFVGLSGFNETEGWDRKNANLPGFQETLIYEVSKVNPNTLVVLISGSYIDVSPWIGEVSGLLFVPYTGEKIGEGIADILSGDQSPSGKLTFSWPNSLDDYPEGAIFTGSPYSESKISNVYSEGIYVGYRWFDKENIQVRYPFGYGLSYSTFEYSELEIIPRDNFTAIVSFNVRNTGKMRASEICQLYIQDLQSDADRPPQELKGFCRVELEPGEVKNCTMELSSSSFSYFHPDCRLWIYEPGEFEVRIGKDSRNIVLKQTIAF